MNTKLEVFIVKRKKKMAKQFELPANLFPPSKQLHGNEFGIPIEKRLEIVQQHLPADIKRGDILHVPDFGDYRNCGKYFFDGKKVVPMEDENNIDEYGYVPCAFKLNEFKDATYWSKVMAHNSIVWLDVTKMICSKVTVKTIDKDNTFYIHQLTEDQGVTNWNLVLRYVLGRNWQRYFSGILEYDCHGLCEKLGGLDKSRTVFHEPEI